MIRQRVLLGLALAAFLGWLGYLGYAALSKSREPRVSRATLAAAKSRVVAELSAGPDGKPVSRVKGKTLGDDQPFEGEIVNITSARGFTQPGSYLLLLEPDGEEFRLVAPPPSPGYDRPAKEEPVLYPWTPGVQAQIAKLTM